MLMVGVHFDASNARSGVVRHAITHLLSPAHYTLCFSRSPCLSSPHPWNSSIPDPNSYL